MMNDQLYNLNKTDFPVHKHDRREVFLQKCIQLMIRSLHHTVFFVIDFFEVAFSQIGNFFLTKCDVPCLVICLSPSSSVLLFLSIMYECRFLVVYMPVLAPLVTIYSNVDSRKLNSVRFFSSSKCTHELKSRGNNYLIEV